MRRWILPGIILLVFLGCKSVGKFIDPLVGPTRIEPPRTGSISHPADPFYPRQSSPYSIPGASGTTYSGQPWSPPSGSSPGWTPLVPANPASPNRSLPSPPPISTNPTVPPATYPSQSISPSQTIYPSQPIYPSQSTYPSQPYPAQSQPTSVVPGSTLVPGSGGSSAPGSPGTGGTNPPTSFTPQPSQISIPSGPNVLSGRGGSSAGSESMVPANPTSGGVGANTPFGISPASSPPGPSGQPAQPAQPIIRTLEPRTSSQPTTQWAATTPSASAGSISSSGGQLAGTPAPPTSTSLPMGGTGTGASAGPIDLASLPPSRVSPGLPSTNPSSTSSGPASGTAASLRTASASAGPATIPTGTTHSGGGGLAASSASPYGFDPQYQWLRGVLCYSPAEGCWRLRYVAPGCPVDWLGGWVILSHPTGLAGFCPGEPVEVRGQLIYKQYGSCQLPIYQVQEIRRSRA